MSLQSSLRQIPGFDCKEAPEPDRPGSGVISVPDPPTLGAGIPGSVYSEHSYAGLVWHTYDIGCPPAVNVAAQTDTWLGNQLFNVNKAGVAVINGLHYLILDGGGLEPLDSLIAGAVRAAYVNFFSAFVGLAFLLLAVIVFVRIRGGQLAESTRRLAIAFIGLMLGSLSYLSPVTLSQAADELLLDELQDIQAQITGLNGADGRDRLPTVLVDQVVYDKWLRGEFGSPTAPQALEFGRPLLLAQAFSKQEIASDLDPTALIAAKKASFEAIAGQLQEAYPHFQGKQLSRTGAAIYSSMQLAAVGLLQFFAKLLTLVGVLGIRLVVMGLPVIAVVMVVWPNALYDLIRLVGQLIYRPLAMGIVSGLHALLFVELYDPANAVNEWLALLILAVVELVILAVIKPFRQLRGLINGFTAPVGYTMPTGREMYERATGWLPGRRPSPQIDKQAEFYQGISLDPRDKGSHDTMRSEAVPVQHRIPPTPDIVEGEVVYRSLTSASERPAIEPVRQAEDKGIQRIYRPRRSLPRQVESATEKREDRET